jgi:hypothetical protein
MRQARYEIIEDDGSFYGHIPANPGRLGECQDPGSLPGRVGERAGRMLFSIADHTPIPDIDGNRIEIREVA